MSLQLKYGFTPNPIQASQPGGVECTVDLTVTVTAPASGAVDIQSIEITIPIGKPDTQYLTDARNLPTPQYDPTNTPWNIKPEGGTVRITPASGASQELDGTIAFTLPGIVVTPSAGVVSLTIRETYPTGPEAKDSTTYSLVKQAFAFLVQCFKAVPNVLTSLDERVMLHWEVIAGAGVKIAYQVSAPDWMPRDCVHDNCCFTDAHGSIGVQTNELQDTTQFTLDVVSHASGAGSKLGSATCTVTSNLPAFLPGADVKPLGASGRVLSGRWKTNQHANRVSIEVDGQTVDDKAPTDTWNEPYPVVVPAAGTKLTLYAHGENGTVPDTRSFAIHVEAPNSVQAAGALDLVVTHDQEYAVALGARGLTSLQLATGGVDQVDLSWIQTDFGGDVVAAAAAADGNVIVATSHGFLIPLLEPSWGAPWAGWRELQRRVHGLAVVSDPTVAVVLSDVVVLASTSLRGPQPVVLPQIASPVGCAVTPNDSLALVTLPGGEVAVVHLPGGPVEQSLIAAGTSGGAIAISADGMSAVVADPVAAALAVIDIPSRTRVGNTVALPGTPGRVAISPDGRLGIVALPAMSAICIVDIGRRLASPALLPVGGAPGGVAITRDGSAILVAIPGGLLTL